MILERCHCQIIDVTVSIDNVLLEMCAYFEVLEVEALVKEVGSRRSWTVPLLPAASLCAPAPQAAPAVLSTLHTTDKKAPDDQEQTHLPDALWSGKKNSCSD